MVGKAASTDGSTMTTHTCDCGTCDWTWGHVPAADHKPGSIRKICHINQYTTWKEGTKWPYALTKGDTGFSIPEVPHTYAYHHGMFGYMNENQVAISESTIGTVRKLVNNTPSAKIDLTMLSLLGHGAVADGPGMHRNHGRPGRKIRLRLQRRRRDVRRLRPERSLDLRNHARRPAVGARNRQARRGLVRPARPRRPRLASAPTNRGSARSTWPTRTFSWPRPTSSPSPWNRSSTIRRAASRSAGSGPIRPPKAARLSGQGRRSRLWRFYDLVAPSLKLDPKTPNMDLPFSVKPDKKLSVQDVMNLTRDKSYGTIFDPVQGIRGGPFQNPNYYCGTRKITVANVEYTSLVQCRSGLPNTIGGIVWVAFGPQDTSCYMPALRRHDGRPEVVHGRRPLRAQPGFGPLGVRLRRFPHPGRLQPRPSRTSRKPRLEYEGGGGPERSRRSTKRPRTLYAKSPAKAREYLTKTCLAQADKIVAAWWDLGDKLLVKYNHFGFYDSREADPRTAAKRLRRNLAESRPDGRLLVGK